MTMLTIPSAATGRIQAMSRHELLSFQRVQSIHSRHNHPRRSGRSATTLQAATVDQAVNRPVLGRGSPGAGDDLKAC